MIIAAGFGLVVIFNLVSIIWLFLNLKTSNRSLITRILILVLGFLCLLFLIGEKTMLDEIGRETLMGWETLGEWIILYIFLFVQLLYNSSIIILSARKA
jgi:hypothetical protein